MKAFRASASDGSGVTESTPFSAAKKFFETFPNKRKCSVVEGSVDGHFFTVSYGRKSEGKWPSSWKDVTRKTAECLPQT